MEYLVIFLGIGVITAICAAFIIPMLYGLGYAVDHDWSIIRTGILLAVYVWFLAGVVACIHWWFKCNYGG